MYSSIEYVSLGEIIHKFSTQMNVKLERDIGNLSMFDEVQKLVMVSLEDERNLAWRVGEYFSAQPSLSVCLTTGGMVRISEGFLHVSDTVRELFYDFHPCLKRHTYYISTSYLAAKIDEEAELLREALKRTSENEATDGKTNHQLIRLVQMRYLKSRFEPLNGGSVQISKLHAPREVSQLQTTSRIEATTSADLIKAILDHAEAGGRRDDIKRLVAPDMTIDAWRAIWRQAAQIDAKLSKPGPKQR